MTKKEKLELATLPAQPDRVTSVVDELRQRSAEQPLLKRYEGTSSPLEKKEEVSRTLYACSPSEPLRLGTREPHFFVSARSSYRDGFSRLRRDPVLDQWGARDWWQQPLNALPMSTIQWRPGGIRFATPPTTIDVTAVSSDAIPASSLTPPLPSPSAPATMATQAATDMTADADPPRDEPPREKATPTTSEDRFLNPEQEHPMNNTNSLPPGWETVMARVDRLTQQLAAIEAHLTNPAPEQGGRILQFPTDDSANTATPGQHAEQAPSNPTPNPFPGLMPPSIPGFGPPGMPPWLSPAGASGLPARPVVLRDVRRTLVHDLEGTITNICTRATEEVRTVDPETGAQTFLTTEHQFMSVDGDLMTQDMPLYRCTMCKRGPFARIHRCCACGRNVCGRCAGWQRRDGEMTYWCGPCYPRPRGGFLGFLERLLS